MGCNIAIDGPAGAGKSTIAKKVAKELSFIYVDTGAMYRAMALYLLNHGVNGENQEEIEAVCSGADISIEYKNGEQIVILNGENVNAMIRTEQVGNMASKSSANPKVRAHLLKLQRTLAEKNDVVMDGRDIGTTILPNAEVKIYLKMCIRDRGKTLQRAGLNTLMGIGTVFVMLILLSLLISLFRFCLLYTSRCV